MTDLNTPHPRRKDMSELDEKALDAAVDAHLAWRGRTRVAGQDFGEQQRDILRQQTDAAIRAYLAAAPAPTVSGEERQVRETNESTALRVEVSATNRKLALAREALQNAIAAGLPDPVRLEAIRVLAPEGKT